MGTEPLAAEDSSPFEPQAADLGGCGKPAVIGCLALLVLLAVGFAMFMFKVRDILGWALVKYQDAVVANLSEEVTDEDKQRLVIAFESARGAIRANRFDPEALQRLQRFMASPPKAGRPIEPEAVRELTEVLEAVGKPATDEPDPELKVVDSGTTAARLAYRRHAAV